ncbi:MAG: DUF2868 domain-containing protein [Burkholderiales bacterium]|nr:DUF2868 domain-containing protein [Burkholderiales bacterium]
MAVYAVRAVETADRARASWSDADRTWATRAAAEVVGAQASPQAFIARRAQLALERLRERKHRVARVAWAWRTRTGVGPAIAVVAFVLGAASNEIGGTQRVNILYSPVAPLVLWNLAVYAVLAAGFVVRYGDASAPGPLRRFVAWLTGGVRSMGRGGDDTTMEAMAAFAGDWSTRATPLYAARAARILHIAAAALALGVITGLYVRGLVLEYRATWQSTFLEPSTVRALVAFFYAPGSMATGIAVPDVARIAAIRAPASENAAPWLHIMAATLAVVAVVPRVLLALAMGWIEKHRTAHLLDDLSDAYFQRLLRDFAQGPLVVDVVPYSFATPPATRDSLKLLLARALGDRVSVEVAPPVAYGNEDALPPQIARNPGAPLVALFNATATPEREAHGRFVQALAQSGRPVLVVVDEASARTHFGNDPQRRDARRTLWRELAADAGHTAVFVDLAQPDVNAAEAAFDAALRR